MGERTGDNTNGQRHPETGHGAHFGGIGKADHEHFRHLNQTSKTEAPSLHKASVSADGSITIHPTKGDQLLTESPQHPFYLEQSSQKAPDKPRLREGSLDLAESALKLNKSTDVKDKEGKVIGKQYADPRGHSTFTEMNDGTKTWSTDDAQGSTKIEKKPDGSWSEAITNKDTGKSTVTNAYADGSATRTETTPDEKATATWGPGGTFQEETYMNQKTGRGTITKPDANGQLHTEPLTQI